jgi:hypothetical protein
MSKTVPVCRGDEMFWAFDVALGVLFAEAARVAEEEPAEHRPDGWDGLVRRLRVHALMGADHAVVLDDFTAEELRAVLGWTAEAAERLDRRGGVTASDVAAWNVLDARTVDPRAARQVSPGALAELARALADLAAGVLEPAPQGRHWYIGTPDGRVLQGG